MSGVLRLSVVIDGKTQEATVAVDKATDALRKFEAQAQSAGKGVTDSTKLSSQQLSQMQFQLQDIAVGLTSGQSPFTVLMQQGSQLAQSFASGTGVMAALKSVGGGILAFVTNPLNLAVIAFSLTAAAATSFFNLIANSGTEGILQQHEDLVKRIGDAWDVSTGKLKGYSTETKAILLNSAMVQQDKERRALAEMMPDYGRMQVPIPSSGNAALDAQISGMERQFKAALLAGTGDVKDFLDSIARVSTQSGVEGARLLVDRIKDVYAPLLKAQADLEQTNNFVKGLQGDQKALNAALGEGEKQARSAASAIDGLARSLGAINPRAMPLQMFDNGPSPGAGKSLLDLIGTVEGTDRGRGYNETLGYGRFTGGAVELTSMTLKQVIDLQSQILAQTRALSSSDPLYNSSAVGRYQITRQTLTDFMPRLGLTGDMVFTPEVQDKIALAIADAAGRSVDKLTGRWEGLKRANPDVILSAFDSTSAGRSSLADEQARADAAERAKAAKALEVNINKQLAAGAKEMLKTYGEVYQQQVTFTNQFRGLFDGVVTSIAQAREEGKSLLSSLGAGLDAIKNKGLSILDSFISKSLDAAAFGAPGTAGGGIFGGILGSLFRPTPNALGNVFAMGSIVPHSKGDVIGSKSYFPMSGGRIGSLAEDDAEAIVPLQRSASGHLGVRSMGGGRAVFNQTIVNNAGVEVTSRTRENSSGGLDIETMIERKIDQHLGKSETQSMLAASLGTRPPVRQWG